MMGITLLSNMDDANDSREDFVESDDDSNSDEFEEETNLPNGDDNETRRVIRKSLIRFLSQNNIPTLEMISSEDDEALLDDFGKYLSLLPPSRLSDSDSNDIEFFESFAEPSNTSKTFPIQMKPFSLTKKQWQSCLDLFGKKQIAKLLRKTSRSVLRKQASLLENCLENDAQEQSVVYNDDVPRGGATVS